MQHGWICALYEAHGYHIYQRCCRILRNKEEANDACQEVFLRLVEVKKPLEPEASLPWLYRVATNHCIDLIRRSKRVEFHVSLEEIAGSHSSNDEIAEREMLRKLWDALSVEERRLLLLRYVDGLSLDEMEDLCEMTRKTISKRLIRLQKKAKYLLSGKEIPRFFL